MPYRTAFPRRSLPPIWMKRACRRWNVWLPWIRPTTVCVSWHLRAHQTGRWCSPTSRHRGKADVGVPLLLRRITEFIFPSSFIPDTLPTDIVEITAWTAVATNNAIEEVCGVRAGIKWVNDLVIDRKKICGILTEMSVESESGYIQYLIIGIGINVNGQAEDFPEEVRHIATSLAMETGKAHSRAAGFAAALIRELDSMCRAWPKEKTEYLEAYRRDNITTGKEITVVRGTEEAPAFAVAIGDDFSLRVRYADGRSEALSSGEISIKGLYN